MPKITIEEASKAYRAVLGAQSVICVASNAASDCTATLDWAQAEGVTAEIPCVEFHLEWMRKFIKLSDEYQNAWQDHVLSCSFHDDVDNITDVRAKIVCERLEKEINE